AAGGVPQPDVLLRRSHGMSDGGGETGVDELQGGPPNGMASAGGSVRVAGAGGGLWDGLPAAAGSPVEPREPSEPPARTDCPARFFHAQRREPARAESGEHVAELAQKKEPLLGKSDAR